MREVKSYCRFCLPFCGTKVTLDDDDQIIDVRGDKEDLMTRGYICFKGVQAPASHRADDRVLHPLKRQSDGTFTRISLELALDEIAQQVRQTIDRNGPESVGGYRGSGSLLNASATSNFDMTNPTKCMKEARARGLKLIVIDPRRTETAKNADVFLQPYPGEDPTVAAGLVRIILSEAWEDKDFCQRYVADIDKVRAAVDPFTPEYVAKRAGINAADLVKAAHMYAVECQRGGASTGTGPSMAPFSNLSEHLVETLNIICGRYMREGEQVPNPGVLRARQPRKAQVTAAPRWWDDGYKSRIGGYGMLGDEMMSGILCDEMLEPGEGRIRAFIAHGSNVANVIPDQRKTVRALKSLDLLVSIDPYLTETSRLAHYVLPTKLGYERADLTMFLYESLYTEPYARYTPAVAAPPPDSELVDDWEIFWGLAKRLNLELVYDGVPLDMSSIPTTDSLLAIIARHAPVSFETLKSLELGGIFNDPPPIRRARGTQASGPLHADARRCYGRAVRGIENAHRAWRLCEPGSGFHPSARQSAGSRCTEYPATAMCQQSARECPITTPIFTPMS